MSNNTAKLSFDEAFNQAQAEMSRAGDDSSPTAIGEPATAEASEVEQVAVETEDENGLFDVLASDDAENNHPEEELFEVKVRGETIKVSLDELKRGYSREADYTQSKQELAEMRRQYENAITLWEALEADYVGTVQKLMGRAGIQGSLNPRGAKGAEEPADIEALVEQKLQEKLAADPRFQRFEQEAALREIEAIFSDIERAYDIQLTTADKRAVLERAQSEGTTNLHMVVGAMLQERQRKLAAQQNLELTSTVQGRRSGVQEDFTPQPQYYSTVSEAWNASLAEEGDFL